MWVIRFTMKIGSHHSVREERAFVGPPMFSEEHHATLAGPGASKAVRVPWPSPIKNDSKPCSARPVKAPSRFSWSSGQCLQFGKGASNIGPF